MPDPSAARFDVAEEAKGGCVDACPPAQRLTVRHLITSSRSTTLRTWTVRTWAAILNPRLKSLAISTLQLKSHREKFHNSLWLNDPVGPITTNRSAGTLDISLQQIVLPAILLAKSPAGTPEISQGQRPWKATQIMSCVPQGTPESAPKPTNSETHSTKGWVGLRWTGLYNDPP